MHPDLTAGYKMAKRLLVITGNFMIDSNSSELRCSVESVVTLKQTRTAQSRREHVNKILFRQPYPFRRIRVCLKREVTLIVRQF